jgi:hypothetical protein
VRVSAGRGDNVGLRDDLHAAVVFATWMRSDVVQSVISLFNKSWKAKAETAFKASSWPPSGGLRRPCSEGRPGPFVSAQRGHTVLGAHETLGVYPCLQACEIGAVAIDDEVGGAASLGYGAAARPDN